MEKQWAYSWMIAVLVTFIRYQLFQLTQTPSLGLVALTVFDILVLVLTGHEYGRHSQRRKGMV